MRPAPETGPETQLERDILAILGGTGGIAPVRRSLTGTEAVAIPSVAIILAITALGISQFGQQSASKSMTAPPRPAVTSQPPVAAASPPAPATSANTIKVAAADAPTSEVVRPRPIRRHARAALDLNLTDAADTVRTGKRLHDGAATTAEPSSRSRKARRRDPAYASITKPSRSPRAGNPATAPSSAPNTPSPVIRKEDRLAATDALRSLRLR